MMKHLLITVAIIVVANLFLLGCASKEIETELEGLWLFSHADSDEFIKNIELPAGERPMLRFKNGVVTCDNNQIATYYISGNNKIFLKEKSSKDITVEIIYQSKNNLKVKYLVIPTQSPYFYPWKKLFYIKVE